MPFFYLDASALVKAYLEELGSHWVRSLTTDEHVSISAIAIAEVSSALARRSDEDDLSLQQAQRAFTEFLDDTKRFDVLAISDSVLRRAASWSLSTGRASPSLRALDSIHLATVMQSSILLRQSTENPLVFVVADKRLRAAATAAGLAVENPEDHA